MHISGDLVGDLRHSLRTARRMPGVTAAAILTIALTIAVATSVFSFVRATLIRPLPYEQPDRLVLLANMPRAELPRMNAATQLPVSTPAELAFWRQSGLFTDTIAFESWTSNPSAWFDWTGPGGPERLRGAIAATSMFHVLGIEPLLGRTFSIGDENAPAVAILGYQFWRRAFQGDPAVIGRPISLETGSGRSRARRVYTIVGVLPRTGGFTYPYPVDVWLPLTPADILRQPADAVTYVVLGRLRSGLSARAATSLLTELTASTHPLWLRWQRPSVIPLASFVTAHQRAGLTLVGTVVVLLVMLGCGNVAALVLVQAARRKQEFAVRRALGANAWQITRQLWTEATVQVALGLGAGLLIASWIQPAFRALAPRQFWRADESVLAGPEMLAAGIVGLLMWLVIAISPGVFMRDRNLAPDLPSSSHLTADRKATRLRAWVVAGEVAFATVLLCTAIALLQSFVHLRTQDLGFTADSLIAAQVRVIHPVKSDESYLQRFQTQVLERLRSMPGVLTASAGSALPFHGTDWMVRLQGFPSIVKLRTISPDYFRTLNVPLVAGRYFGAADRSGAEPVAIVSEKVASRLWPGGNPLGRTLDAAGEKRRVVGVVGDVRTIAPGEEPVPAVYVPSVQVTTELIAFFVRTASSAVTPRAIETVIREVDPDQPIERAAYMEELVSDAIADTRFVTSVATLFGLLGLALATIGLVGVLARSAVERLHEMAIRAALGATRRQLRLMVIATGLRPVAIGLGMGLAAAVAGSRLVRALAPGLLQYDLSVAALAALGTILVTTVASDAIGRRAASADPASLLRAE